MSFSRPIQWYHSHIDLIWPKGGTFNPEACVLLFIYKFLLYPASVSIVYLFCAWRLCCVLGPAHVLSLCSNLFCLGRLCYVLGPAYVLLFIYFVWEDCVVCWAQHVLLFIYFVLEDFAVCLAQHMFYYLSILCGKPVLCLGPSICSIIYLFYVGSLCCVFGQAYVL